MKNILLIVLTIFLSFNIYAQPDSEIFPDFIYTDLDGQTHHLQSYLDQGKTVVIDVFATWCTVCQASVGGWESLYNTHGQAGDQSMVLLSFERDANTNNEAMYIENFGVESPVITEADDIIDELWNITYQPRYFVICPDGTFGTQISPPIYEDPQSLIDLSEECEPVVGINEIDDLLISIGVTDGSINYFSNETFLQYEIYDMLGSQMKNGQINDTNGQIDISAWPTGIYLFQVRNDNQSSTIRIVKR